MQIKKVNVENIRSYEKAEVVFPAGSTLLAGDIGSGKTTILMAIEFALFGLQPGQRGSSLLKNGKNEGRVILEFEVDGKNIIIERHLKKGKTISQSYCSISIDNEQKEISVMELKNQLLTLLSYPKEFEKKTNLLYKFTVYTPQEEMKQIILEDAQTRLDTLRHIFGIDKYKRVRENTSLFTSKLREEIRNKQGQVQDIEQKKETLLQRGKLSRELGEKIILEEEEFGKKEKERKNQEENLKKVEAKIEEKRKLESEVEKTKIMLIGKREMIQSIAKEQKNIAEDLARKMEFNQNKLKELEVLKKEGDEQEKNLTEAVSRILAEIKSLDNKNLELEEQRSRIEKIKVCPTCLQDVDPSYKQNISLNFEEQISGNKNKIKKLKEDREKNLFLLEKLKSQTQEISRQIEELKILKIKVQGLEEKKKKFEENKKTLETLNKDMDMLDKHIDLLKISISKLGSIDIIYEREKSGLNNKVKEEKNIEIKIAELKKELELNKKSIEDLDREIQEKEKIKSMLAYITELEDWLSSEFLNLVSFTETNVMFKLREEFSKLFNQWFSILVPENFFARLDEEFTPIIEQQDYELAYSYLSGGERTAVALAYRLALNQVINSLLSKIKTRDLVILDEPTDGFSDQQLDKFGDIFTQLNFNQLIIVSHEQKIESFVENIIKFRKDNNLSQVDYES